MEQVLSEEFIRVNAPQSQLEGLSNAVPSFFFFFLHTDDPGSRP